MSDMSTHLDARRLSDLARDPNHVAAAIATFEAARDAHPRLAAELAILRTVADATKPRDVSCRPCFDADYGTFSDHWLDPRTTELVEETTEDDARSEATEQVLNYSESVADWLAKACDCEAGRQPIDVRALTPLQIIEGAPHLLLAVLMNGDNTQALRALHRLRELAAVEFRREIAERAAAILREVA